MSWTIELWVEGPTDANTGADGALRGALPPMVKRTLAELANTDGTEVCIEPQILSTVLRDLKVRIGLAGKRGQYSLHAKKILTAFEKVLHAGRLAIAVWDADGRPERVRDRNQILGDLRERGKKGAVAGTCIPCVEAWLLADEGGFKRCFGIGPATGVPGDPEAWTGTSQALKEKLHEVIRSCKEASPNLEHDVCSTSACYGRLAEKTDLAALASKCPKGYGALREALNEFLVPCFCTEPSR
ncbi:MAG: hypothetical protein HY744_01390 [Deltaproteobacteria bacterium]|nr:hypothetical protein [Deltaproteobacteria bacterium]